MCVDRINLLLDNVNTIEISNLITINEDIISLNKLYNIFRRKQTKNHGLLPMNTAKQFPRDMAYPKSINQILLYEPLFPALVVPLTK